MAQAPLPARTLSLVKPLEDRYRDLMPPAGWKPKSDFFKSIWAKAEFKRDHPTVTITCPCCGEPLTLSMESLKPQPKR